MPLTPEEEKNIQKAKFTMNSLRQDVAKLPGYFESAEALNKLNTGGKKLDYSKMTTEELRSIFRVGKADDNLNRLATDYPGNALYDPENKWAPLRLQKVDPDSLSRGELIEAVDTWMRGQDYNIDPADIVSAQMRCTDCAGALSRDRSEAQAKYYSTQDAAKERGEEYSDSQLVSSFREIKAEEEKYDAMGLEKKPGYLQAGLISAVENYAQQGRSAREVKNMLHDMDDFAQRYREKAQQPLEMNLSGCNLSGLNLAQSDLSGFQIDAETLSRAEGLDTVQGVEPQLLAEAQAIKPHVEKLDQLRGELKAIEGKKNNLLHNYDKKREKLQADIQLEEQAMQQAREGVEQQFAVENEFEPKSSYRLGPDVSRRPVGVQDPRILDQQASVTYSVNSSSALNEQGSKLGFAKQQIGTKSSDLKKQDNVEKSQIEKAKNQEWNALGMMGVLHGKFDEVQALDIDRMDFDDPQSVQQVEQAVGGNLSTLLSRSVATSVVDKALGMNSMAVEKIAVDENNKCVGLSVGVPGQPVLKRPDNLDKQEDCLDIDYSEPAIQKGFYDLEAQDYITGQIDRHTGNIFVDPHSGQVSGIDNDLAFPTINREEMIQKSKLGKKTVPGMPQFLHSDTADKIEALTPESLRESLSNMELPDGVAPLEPKAIEGAVQRLGELQAEIKQMRREGRVVSAFTPQTFEAAMQKQLDQQQKQSPNTPNEIGADDGVTRTSYLAAACIEKEKSIREGKRNLIKANQVQKAPSIDPKLNAYQQGVQAAKQNLLNNPQQIQNAPLAAVIMKAPAQIQALRQQLDRETNNLAVISGQIRDAEAALEAAQTPEARQKVQKKVNDLNGAFDRTQEQRQTTLQNLAAAQKKLDRALDQAVKPQKQQIAEHARNAFVVGFKPQTQQGSIVGRRPLPQNNNNIQPSQRPAPPPRNTNNNIPPSQRPVPPPRSTNNNGPTRANAVRNDQRNVTIRPGTGQPVDINNNNVQQSPPPNNNNNIQPSRRPAPVLVRGALPPPNNNNNQQGQQHGTAAGSTGDSLRRSGERSTSPRPQLANSTGTNIKRSPPPPPPKKGFGSGPPP